MPRLPLVGRACLLLKTQHGVSTTVVRQAILVLQTQGWVQGVHGLGVFVADR
ncbi:GntR family transcriptional regulator [Micromonospora zamorensis]|uniref:GntR family transcriptional regulator n=1 Tax=Micromonospora zamorensis TaxID=709883 RepID=UPI00399D64FB